MVVGGGEEEWGWVGGEGEGGRIVRELVVRLGWLLEKEEGVRGIVLMVV